jgi:hypothetical protein
MKFPLHKIVCALLLVLYIASFNLMTIHENIIHEQRVDGTDVIYNAEPETEDYIIMVITYIVTSIIFLSQAAASYLNKEKVVLYMAVFLFSISFVLLLPLLLLEAFHGKTFLLKEVAWQYYCFIILQAILLVTTDTKDKTVADNQ